MSAPLKLIAKLYARAETQRELEVKKDLPLNLLGTTYRDLQIAVWRLGSDLLGEDWLGHHLIDALSLCHAPIVVVPDFGRSAEVAVLLHEGLLVKQLKLVRAGTTFEGDSREDFTIPGPSNSRELANNGTLTDLRYSIEQLIPWLSERPSPRTHPSEELTTGT
jgi:hypothetical protein